MLDQNEGEGQVARALFLRADLDLSLRLLAPQLLLHRPSLGLQEDPPYSLALYRDRALLMDHGTVVALWTVRLFSLLSHQAPQLALLIPLWFLSAFQGSELCGDEARCSDAKGTCLAAMSELTQNRFPVPRLIVARVRKPKISCFHGLHVLIRLL